MPKSVAIIGSVGVPPKYGGYETFTDQLVRHLGNQFDFTVYCSAKRYEHRLNDYCGAKLVYLPFNANGFQSIIYDITAIFHALSRSDTLLILGVSGCTILPIVRLISRKKILVNMDGMEWKRGKWSGLAKAFLKLSEAFAVKYAGELITDNAEIQRYVMNAYGREGVLIAYGGDHAVPERDIEEYSDDFGFLRGKYAFGVCRIEPENQVASVLEAFSAMDGFPLALVGNWENSAYGRKLKATYEQAKNMYMIDAIYDQKKLDVLRSNCSLYIHGHSAGGTNCTLVEAMSLGLPIVAYDVAYNRETTENKAIYFKDTSELIAILQSMGSFNLEKVSNDMHEIAQRRYRWDIIASKYAALF
jgi:glycosyltransferase involved in cell wall biosynthesis